MTDDIERKLMDLENRVRWLELSYHPASPRYPETTYQINPACYQQTPSTQACMPDEYNKGVNYDME